MKETGENKKRKLEEHREGEALEQVWLNLKRLWDIIALCVDGFYLRQEANFDVVVNIMESYKNNVDEILKMVCQIAEEIEREQEDAKN